MQGISKSDNLGDCQGHMPFCYGNNAIKFNSNRNEAVVINQQKGYENSVLSTSTTTSTGFMSMATTGLTTTMGILMECHWQSLCSYENLELAFNKAKKRKSNRPDVKEFEKDLKNNLENLRLELLFYTYNPKPLKTFVIKDPKTRVIKKSDFKDRIVHHAICNLLEPLFEKTFIFDSYANRKGKGTLKAIQRFDFFKRKVSKNFTRRCYVLKADIRHYFDEINHDILLGIIKEKVKDKKIIWLITKILKNNSSERGMPLGNLTSQFLANCYLNKLDHFVKQELKAKYYIRYVDDFVVLSNDKEELEGYKSKIQDFLKINLNIELHNDKSRVINLKRGITFLGFRIFEHHKLLRKSNIHNLQRKISEANYDGVCEYLDGWLAYANQANTFKLRQNIISSVENKFLGEISLSDIDRYDRMVEI